MRYLCAATVILAFLALAQSRTSADTITTSVTTNYGSGAYLGAGAARGDTFDIRGALAGGSYAAPFDLSNVTVTFDFTDDGDGYTQSTTTGSERPFGAVYGAYTLDASTNRLYQERYLRTIADVTTTRYDGTSESVRVGLGGGQAGTTGSVNSVHAVTYGSTYLDSRTDLTAHTYAGTRYWAGAPRYFYYDNFDDDYLRQVTRYTGYQGDFSLTLSLDSAALADLSADGLLSWSTYGLSGDSLLRSTTISFTATSPVPEPATLACVGAGLLGLIGGSRRRRRRAR